jgi:hypothetical protein
LARTQALRCCSLNGFEQAQLAKEVAVVEVGDDHFVAVVVLDQDGDRALDDERQGLGPVAGADDVAFGGVATALAVHQQLFDVLDLGARAEATITKSCSIRGIGFLLRLAGGDAPVIWRQLIRHSPCFGIKALRLELFRQRHKV